MIPLKGFKLDKHGKVVRRPKRQSVSDRIRSKNSKKQRVVSKHKAALKDR